MRHLLLAVLACSLSACSTTTSVRPNTSDSSPAIVSVGSINLAPDLDITTAAGPAAPWTGRNLADGATEFAVTVSATDAESGIAQVSIDATLRAWCHADAMAVSALQSVTASVSAQSVISVNADGTRPESGFAILTVQLARVRALCPAGQQLVDWQVDTVASARNGNGIDTSPVQASVVNGPVQLRIATLNMSAPCLEALDNLLPIELFVRNACIKPDPPLTIFDPLPGPSIIVPINSILDRWGAFFATQDIVFLNEAVQRRWIDRMLLSMPGFSVAHHGMVAILSRFPLHDVRNDSITSSFSGQGIPLIGVTSEYVRATLAPRGRPMVVYGVHWAHRPASPESSPNRVSMATRMTRDIGNFDRRTPVLISGDFNSKSRFVGPNDMDFNDLQPGTPADERARMIRLYNGLSMPEIGIMQGIALDAREEIVTRGPVANYDHVGGGWPVDFLFLRGDYAPVRYSNSNGAIATPSDHPMLEFSLERIQDPR